MDNQPKLQKSGSDRNHIIVRTSIIGIAANLFLAAFKAAVGIFSNSIAVTLDAVNNLSDALSSVITIIGTKLAGRKPDKKHPLGHGRTEYISEMIVSAIILYAGITAFVESVKKIIHPEEPDYSIISLIIIATAIAVKLILGRYVSATGKKVNSGSLIASGKDASFDAILSSSVLLSAIIFMIWHINLEAYVGVIISGFIIKSGIEMLRETYDELLGKRVDKEYIDEIKKTICSDPAVFGAYDLILHSYGPERYVGSVHVEVADTMTAEEIDVMERRIAGNVFVNHGVILAGIGIYSRNTRDDAVTALRSDINRIVMSHDGVIQMHGFHVDQDKKLINLDVIIDFSLSNREEIFAHIQKEVQDKYPDYTVQLTMDIDI